MLGVCFKRACKRFVLAAAGVAALGLAVSPAGATYDPAHQFIVNGDFEQLTNGLGELALITNAVGWTSHDDGEGHYGYNFAMNMSSATTTGAPGESTLRLWGPGDQFYNVNNGLTASPTGGNFIAADGDYHKGKITQDITGLIIGESYALTFSYAGAQEFQFDGPTTEAFQFGLEGMAITQQTQTLNNVNHGFTGWHTQTFKFVATQTSDTLFFLAQGTPAGQPPFALLDSVSLVGAFGTPVTAPEPGTWALMLIGFGLVGLSMRRRTAPRGLAFG